MSANQAILAWSPSVSNDALAADDTSSDNEDCAHDSREQEQYHASQVHPKIAPHLVSHLIESLVIRDFVSSLRGVVVVAEDSSHESERNAVQDEHDEIPDSGEGDWAVRHDEWEDAENNSGDDCENAACELIGLDFKM